MSKPFVMSVPEEIEEAQRLKRILERLACDLVVSEPAEPIRSWEKQIAIWEKQIADDVDRF